MNLNDSHQNSVCFTFKCHFKNVNIIALNSTQLPIFRSAREYMETLAFNFFKNLYKYDKSTTNKEF